MSDDNKLITKLQLAIAAAIDTYDRVTCAEVAERASDQLGYEPSLPNVSRVLAAWGWSKTTIGGRVGFVRPLAGPPAYIKGEAAVRQWYGERDRLFRERMGRGEQ